VNVAALKSRAAEICAAFLVAAALGAAQILVGGTRLLFSLPAYGLLGIGGLLTFLALRRVKPQPNQICFASSAFFFGYILVRALFSPVAYLARVDIFSVLGGLLIYFLVACFFTESKKRMALMIFLMTIGILHVVIGAIQFRDGNNFMPIPFLQRADYGPRASGFYVCPNHLAGALEVLGIFGASLVCWSRFPIWSKLLVGYAAAVCYLGVLLTGSRGGYASSVVSLFVLAILSLIILRRASTRLFWSIGGVGLLAALIIGGSAMLMIKKTDFLADRTQNAFDTLPVRFDLWHAAIEQCKVAPWLGTGSGTYLYYGRMFRTERMEQDPVFVHNDYLQLLAEYGALGGLFFLFFFGAHLHNGWKNFQRLGPKRVAVSPNLLSTSLALNLGALGAVAAYVVHSIVDFNLHIPANALLLAFVFGVLANAGVQLEVDPPRVSRSILGWRLLLPLIALVVAIESVRLLPGEYFAERARIALRDDQLESGARFATCGLAYERCNPNLFQYLGSARIDQGDTAQNPATAAQFYQAAIEAFESGRALAPREEAFALGMADAYDSLGRFTEGEWMYQETLALDPRSRSLASSYQAHLKKWRDSGTNRSNNSAPRDGGSAASIHPRSDLRPGAGLGL